MESTVHALTGATALRSSTHQLVRSAIGGLIVFLVGSVGAQDEPRRSPIVTAIEKTRSSIVNLRTLRVIPARFENVEQGRVRGLGTGVVIDPRGYVITNYHVVEDVSEIEARVSDGERFSARVVADDRRNDLAILKIESNRTLPFLPLRGAGPAILGETVIAIGNPYGLEDSVTQGIVSSVNRVLQLPNGETFKGLIQIDASINPGNSGGPLITIDGELLGVNVAIRSNAQGIAFAIPTATVREIVANMMRNPRALADQGMHVGVEASAENGIVRAGGVDGASGHTLLRINQVDTGSSAERAGIREHDEVIAVNGQEIDMLFDLERNFWDRKPGESVVLKIRRQEQEIEVPLLIGGRVSDHDLVWDHLGVKARPVVDPVRKAQPKWLGGLFIMQVRPNSPAALAGFKPGDILCGLHKHMTTDHASVVQIMKLNDFATQQLVAYDLLREGKVVTGHFAIPAPQISQ